MKAKRNRKKNEIQVETQKESKTFSFDEMKDIISNTFEINADDEKVNKVKNIFANKENIQSIISKNSTNVDNIYTLAESYVNIFDIS
jgi:hypothetical protein